MSNIVACQSGLLVAPFTVYSKLIESVRSMWFGCHFSRPSASVSTVSLDVVTLKAALSSWMVVELCFAVKVHLDPSLLQKMQSLLCMQWLFLWHPYCNNVKMYSLQVHQF